MTKKIKQNNLEDNIKVISFFTSVIIGIFYFTNFFIIQQQDIELGKIRSKSLATCESKIYKLEKNILIINAKISGRELRLKYLEKKFNDFDKRVK